MSYACFPRSRNDRAGQGDCDILAIGDDTEVGRFLPKEVSLLAASDVRGLPRTPVLTENRL